MREAVLEAYNLTTPSEQVVEVTIHREDEKFYYCQDGKIFPKNVWRRTKPHES